MSIHYEFVNFTKKETLSFPHLPSSTAFALLGFQPEVGALALWYMLKNAGDLIIPVRDYEMYSSADAESWPFPESHEEVSTWPDVTDTYLNDLVSRGVLADCGKRYQDDEDPKLYIRHIENLVVNNRDKDGPSPELYP